MPSDLLLIPQPLHRTVRRDRPLCNLSVLWLSQSMKIEMLSIHNNGDPADDGVHVACALECLDQLCATFGAADGAQWP